MSDPIEATQVLRKRPPLLIVDDDPLSAKLVAAYLEEAGYETTCAQNPLKAIPLLRKEEYALVLLDQNMPGMDGLALLEEIRKESSVPVIMLTASDRSDLAVRAIRLGAFDYLTKPVDERRLIETVAQAVGSGVASGERIAHYALEKEIGRGGMGVVYAARDPRLGRRVALKVLLPEFAADPSYERRFLAEARSAAQFSHPNIVTVFDAGRWQGRLYIAMEFVSGRTLEDYVGAGTALPGRRVVEIGLQAASALEALHAAGLVHRDLKPGNLMITDDAVLKVLDFGLVRPEGPGSEESRKTVSGTLCYHPPELLLTGRSDARGDLYALGVVLYELLAGARAFESRSQLDVMHRISEGRISRPWAEIPGLPAGAEAVVGRMMALQPEQRYASVAEARAALAALPA